MSNIEIRRAQTEDLHNLSYIFEQEFIANGYSDEEIQQLKSTPYAPSATAQRIVEAWEQGEDSPAAWIAFDGDRPVAGISTKDVSGGVWVDEGYRRQGIGSALTRIRLEHCVEHNLPLDSVTIESTNEASLKMHRGLSFKFDKASQDLVDKAQRAGQSLSDIRQENGSPARLRLLPPQ